MNSMIVKKKQKKDFSEVILLEVMKYISKVWYLILTLHQNKMITNQKITDYLKLDI